jgi:hypothetical protein
LLSGKDNFPSFLRLMRKYLRVQRSFSRYLRNPPLTLSLVSKLRVLENYRVKILSSWLLRWKLFTQRFVLFRQALPSHIATSRLRRRYVYSLKRMLRLRRRLLLSLSRLSQVAHELRRRSFSIYAMSSAKGQVKAKRKRFSFKRALRKSLLPTLFLFKRKSLFRRISLRRRFLLRSYRRNRLRRARFVTSVRRKVKARLRLALLKVARKLNRRPRKRSRQFPKLRAHESSVS